MQSIHGPPAALSELYFFPLDHPGPKGLRNRASARWSGLPARKGLKSGAPREHVATKLKIAIVSAGAVPHSTGLQFNETHATSYLSFANQGPSWHAKALAQLKRQSPERSLVSSHRVRGLQGIYAAVMHFRNMTRHVVSLLEWEFQNVCNKIYCGHLLRLQQAEAQEALSPIQP